LNSIGIRCTRIENGLRNSDFSGAGGKLVSISFTPSALVRQKPFNILNIKDLKFENIKTTLNGEIPANFLVVEHNTCPKRSK
jgi:hypothetical protein